MGWLTTAGVLVLHERPSIFVRKRETEREMRLSQVFPPQTTPSLYRVINTLLTTTPTPFAVTSTTLHHQVISDANHGSILELERVVFFLSTHLDFMFHGL